MLFDILTATSLKKGNTPKNKKISIITKLIDEEINPNR